MEPILSYRGRMGLFLRVMAMSLVAAALVVAAGPGVAQADGAAAAEIQRQVEALERGEGLDAFAVRIGGSDVLEDFYRRSGFRPAWTGAVMVDDLLAAIGHAEEQGLDPERYHRGAIVQARPHAGENDESIARFDLLLTSSLVDLAWDVRYGRVPAHDFDRRTLREHPLEAGRDPVDQLLQATDGAQVDALVWSLEPQVPFYRSLQGALAEYRRLAADGDWPLVPAGPSLRPGERDSRVPVLRERLRVTGELPASRAGAQRDAGLYDDATVEAVKAFQRTHGLDDDGVLGAQTVAAMRVTVAERVGQIRATLERAREYLRDLPPRFVMVNAAGYRVTLFEDGNATWRSRAIVGKPDTQTPMFRADMRSVLLNPTWTVPRSIVKNEFLPAMRTDPHYLAKKHISIIDGEYVQAAGPDNALGRIKLNLPNPHSVYLHDTPTRNLFRSQKRAFSHGCVRIENPVQLAAMALDDPQWTVESINAAIDTGKTRTLLMKKPLPVFVLYWSVTFNDDAHVEFFPDLYGRDAELLRALDAAH